MTGTSGYGPRIPNRQTNAAIRNVMQTSGTIDRPNPRSGTNGIGVDGFKYEDLPPPKSHDHTLQSWSLERVGSYLGIAVVAISVIIFFYSMNSNIEIVKIDVKDGKDRIERLDEKVNKQTSAIESVTNSVQRLEGEIRRTQDYVQNRKK